MIRRRKNGRKGSTILEFVLVGIPIIFIFICIFEMSRGMWNYHSIAFGVREGSRYAAMHGVDCASPHTCQVSIGTITGVIRSNAPGIDPATVTLTFTPSSGTATSGTMSSLASSTTTFPPTGANAQGQNVKISANYAFQSILAVFWVGAGRGANYSGTFNLYTSSSEPIQF
jgi:Flp pilus assembly protein TadG